MIGVLIGAWLDVRTKPLRTFAAIAGMVAAVVAVVLVDAAGVLSRNANEIYLARKYGLPVTFTIQPIDPTLATGQNADLESMLRANGIQALSPDATLSGQVTFNGSVAFGGVHWFSSDYPQIRVVDMVAGSWPDQTATGDTLHGVMLEGAAMQYLGLTDRQVVGTQLGLNIFGPDDFDPRTSAVVPLIVDGVVSADTNAFIPGDAPVAIVSDTKTNALLAIAPSMAWIGRVNPDEYAFAQQLVQSVTDDRGSPIYQIQRADQGNTLATVLDQQRVTARAITIVALTIGGLGILGVGIASVRERSRDFGLRRAIGNSARRIFASVVTQTLLEVLIAAAVAIPLAALLLDAFARDLVLQQLPLPPDVGLPIGSIVHGLVGALVVGLLAALLPAIMAVRVSVIEALRA